MSKKIRLVILISLTVFFLFSCTENVNVSVTEQTYTVFFEKASDVAVSSQKVQITHTNGEFSRVSAEYEISSEAGGAVYAYFPYYAYGGVYENAVDFYADGEKIEPSVLLFQQDDSDIILNENAYFEEKAELFPEEVFNISEITGIKYTLDADVREKLLLEGNKNIKLSISDFDAKIILSGLSVTVSGSSHTYTINKQTKVSSLFVIGGEIGKMTNSLTDEEDFFSVEEMTLSEYLEGQKELTEDKLSLATRTEMLREFLTIEDGGIYTYETYPSDGYVLLRYALTLNAGEKHKLRQDFLIKPAERGSAYGYRIKNLTYGRQTEEAETEIAYNVSEKPYLRYSNVAFSENKAKLGDSVSITLSSVSEEKEQAQNEKAELTLDKVITLLASMTVFGGILLVGSGLLILAAIIAAVVAIVKAAKKRAQRKT